MNVALEMYELKIKAVVLFRRGVYGYSTRENSANQEQTSEKYTKYRKRVININKKTRNPAM